MKYLVAILFFFFCVMAVVDLELSEYAVENGFYETNEFTNQYGFTNHFIVLVLSVFFLTVFCRVFVNDEFASFFLILLNVVWLANNIWSVILLG